MNNHEISKKEAMFYVESALNDKKKVARMINEDIRNHGIIQTNTIKRAAQSVKINKHLDKYFKILNMDYEKDIAFMVNWGKGKYHGDNPITELSNVY